MFIFTQKEEPMSEAQYNTPTNFVHHIYISLTHCLQIQSKFEFESLCSEGYSVWQ